MRGELVYGQLYLNGTQGRLYEAAVLLKLTLASFEAFLYQRRIRCKYETKLLFDVLAKTRRNRYSVSLQFVITGWTQAKH